jgi:ribonuclease P protein component
VVAFGRHIDVAGGVPYKPRHLRARGSKPQSSGAEDRRENLDRAAQAGATGPNSSALAERLRETDLPAQQTGAQATPWLSGSHGHQGRTQSAGGPPRPWTQAAQCVTGANPFKPCSTMERLKRRADFRAAASGRRAPGIAFVLQARRRADAGGARVGFTVSRQVGNAVERNRVRRRLREIVRLATAESLHSGHDYVLIGRRGALSLPFGEMMREFDTALRRIHTQKSDGTGGAAKRPLHETGSPAATRQATARRRPPNHER